ncbi:MAG TPA: hypothetical protein VKE74_05840 [Gemmataceae bacterium]|nr:hypothetical protein [Gemmataceae bacterium]
MTDFNSPDSHPEERGHCKACRWWQAEHDGPSAEDTAVGLCMQPELTHFSLQVSGLSGCNRFEPIHVEDANRMSAAAR